MEKLTPEKVQKLLKAKGVEITSDEANSILAFLKKMSTIIVSQYLNKKSSR